MLNNYFIMHLGLSEVVHYIKNMSIENGQLIFEKGWCITTNARSAGTKVSLKEVYKLIPISEEKFDETYNGTIINLDKATAVIRNGEVSFNSHIITTNDVLELAEFIRRKNEKSKN